MAKKIADTPLMKQYGEMKKKHPDALLLFRVGDFYETFSDDAIAASEILGITLTRRANGVAQYVELAGFPHHALDTYLPRLVRAGRRVAICEQLEDPKLAKGIVKRGITELVTPGINFSDTALDSRNNNFLAGIFSSGNRTGAAFLDVSTGEFLCAEGNSDFIDKLLSNISPKELLVMRGLKRATSEKYAESNFFIFELDDWVYTAQAANDRLLRQFHTQNLKGFGVEDMSLGIIAAGSLLYYLDQTNHTQTSHISSLGRIDEGHFVRLDRFTVRNLELTKPLAENGRSLIDYLDKTASPPGARLLRRWIYFPLRDVEAISSRHDIVDHFFRHPDLRDSLHELFGSMGDLERIISKAAAQRVSPRELVQLSFGIKAAAKVRTACANADCNPLARLAARINPCCELAEQIGRTLADDAPAQASRGGFVRRGADAELDELRSLLADGKSYLDGMVQRETEKTGISSLKIGFNNVFGYYFEVRNTHREKVPDDWIRKQTLTQAERYITPELKEYEEKILGAQDRIHAIETRILTELIIDTGRYIDDVKHTASACAQLDVLVSFALAAAEYNYVRPDVNDSTAIHITEGRHPVIERRLPPGEQYVSNSLALSNDDCQIMMITGPNMAGKSALLRQTALIVLLAQCGSFVPAEAASIGIVDKIFTRVGASDNISSGESTFMVEMNEAAAILNNMSDRSLILFDELGRGTSTYDGISIAWAIVEHIHENGRCRPKTLFATHYHELNEMEKTFGRIANYNVSVREDRGKIIFLRRLERGGSAHSFGIHVARLAGMPPSIVKRANQVLHQLEEAARGEDSNTVSKANVAGIAAERDGYQLSFFNLDDPTLSQIRDTLAGLDINSLTPLQALNTLNELQGIITGK